MTDAPRASARKRRVEAAKADVLHLAFRMDNYPHLVAAYGARVAFAVSNAVMERLKAAFSDDGVVMKDAEGHFDIVTWNADGLAGADFHKCSVDRAVAMCRSAALRPVVGAGFAVHAMLSFAWMPLPSADLWPEQVIARNGPTAALLKAAPFQGRPWSQNPGWAEAYRDDMAQATEVLTTITRDGVVLAWQPIRNASRPQAVLYREGLVRAKNRRGRHASPAAFVPALERLGISRAFDQLMVETVLDTLDAHSAEVLGVNISAHSAVDDDWWGGAADRLRSCPDVAERLVIEITETAELPSMELAATFIARMRGLGVRIALDDFGAGGTPVRDVAVLEPDIIKIDARLLHRAPGSTRDGAIFRRMVELAASLAPEVVVEGVQGPAGRRIALEAGATWHQGFLVGEPVVGAPDAEPERDAWRA